MEKYAGSFYIVCAILITLLLAVIIIFKWAVYTKRRSLPPGPSGLPIVGCLIQMIINKPTFQWIHKMMDDMHTEIACILLGGVHVIPVTSPELAREFLKKQDIIFASRPHCMSARLCSSGYLTAILSPMGDQWKKMRGVLAVHVLSPAKHRWLHDKRMEEADNLVRYVYNQCKNSSEGVGLVNVRVAAQQYCGNVIRRMIFGKRYFGNGMEDGGPGTEEEEHVAALFKILSSLFGFSISDYVPWLEFFDFDGYKGILKKAIGSLSKFHDPEIHGRIQTWKKGLRENEEDILDVLINLKDSKGAPLLMIEEIKAQIAGMMIATVDNPSNAFEWALAEMINQPQILKRATAELDLVVGRNRLVQESDLNKLNYVKACAKEAFRLHPIAPFNVPHVSMEDTTVAGYSIPKGSHVMLSRTGLGRNPRIWEDPLKYKPERHLKDDGSVVVLVDSELNMLSFSIGKRGCAGVVLGSTLTTMLFARLIHGFTWNAPPDVTSIDLTESECDLLRAKPLVALAKPRLSSDIYQQIQI
ncbi:isoleucine N-monooxygenase 2-like [Olea europaea var. sylvestris]|uniref:isoleucine N-monooxygenase 2-like n=1 Tax=Olea europaea var. sylvestris TaxID=158386 RepID=UPI000C1D13EE|nr:isoleucine N-monooxygenase 2-like [Olea europaea var. sylvestris]